MIYKWIFLYIKMRLMNMFCRMICHKNCHFNYGTFEFMMAFKYLTLKKNIFVCFSFITITFLWNRFISHKSIFYSLLSKWISKCLLFCLYVGVFIIYRWLFIKFYCKIGIYENGLYGKVFFLSLLNSET